jgi:ABC-type dipeptide/oligopeptide/nickel transport system permease subunit
MVTREGLRFQRKRITGLLRTLARNRMATVGVVLLAFFIFAALAAPILTSNAPGVVVAGHLAQPEWVTNYPDGYYLSRNIVVVQDPLFNSPASIQQWTVTAPSSTLSRLQLSYARGVSDRVSSAGSLQMVYSGSGSGTVMLSQTFHFPYHGPPSDFTAYAHWILAGASTSLPVHVRLFIQQTGGQVFNLVDANETASGTWLPPSPGDILYSEDIGVQAALGTKGTGFSPAQIIFSQIQDYVYGIQVTFYGPQKINIDDIQLSLSGSAYGLMGTDWSGADVWAQFIYGARVSLLVGLLSAGIGISLGLVIGLMAGFLGKIVDEILMRFTDMMLTIPSLPLLIVLVAVLGPNIWNLIIIIGFLGWMGFARIVRSQVLTIRERPFIEAAKASGAGTARIIRVHVFPNIVSLTYVNLALTVPGAILAESVLAFLGLSDPTINSWGHMFENVLNSGTIAKVPPAWWWVLPPGFGIALVSLSFILIGYALDEIFNPRLRKRR